MSQCSYTCRGMGPAPTVSFGFLVSGEGRPVQASVRETDTDADVDMREDMSDSMGCKNVTDPEWHMGGWIP